MDSALSYGYWAILFLITISSIREKRISQNWILITLAITLHAYYFYGPLGILFLITAAGISTSAELISLKTRFNVFGVRYKYNLSNPTFKSRITISGVYPIEVTAAWVLLKYLSFILVGIAGTQFAISPFFRIILSAAALVSFDLMIDPLAVHGNAWKWEHSGRYFGIPWQNFVGWFIVGICVSGLFPGLEPRINFATMMFLPVFAVWLIFPLTLGIKLIKRNPLLGVFSVIPSLLFFVFGIAGFISKL